MLHVTSRRRALAAVAGFGLIGTVFAVLPDRPAVTRHAATPAPNALWSAAQDEATRLARMLDLEWRRHLDLAATLEALGPAAPPEEVRQALDSARAGGGHLAWIGLARATDGRVLAATGGLLEGMDVSRRPWFAAGLRAPFAGDVHDAVLLQAALPGRGEGEPLRLIDFAVPLRDPSGQVTGVLGAHLDWVWIRDLIRDARVPQGARLVLVSEGGEVLFGPLAARKLDHAACALAPVAQQADAPSFGWRILVLPAAVQEEGCARQG